MAADSLTRDVLLAQSGDREALDRCLQAVQVPIYRFVRATLGSDRDAEDVSQDAMVAVCRKIGWLDDAQAFRAWAFQIAWRLAIRSLSRSQRREAMNEELSPSLPAGDVEPLDPWLREILQAEVSRLSPAVRSVIELHYGHELSINEVAAVLGLRPGTVKSRLNAALSQLRQTLSKEVPHESA